MINLLIRLQLVMIFKRINQNCLLKKLNQKVWESFKIIYH